MAIEQEPETIADLHDELRVIRQELAALATWHEQLSRELAPVIQFMQGMQHTVEHHPMLRKFFGGKGATIAE